MIFAIFAISLKFSSFHRLSAYLTQSGNSTIQSKKVISLKYVKHPFLLGLPVQMRSYINLKDLIIKKSSFSLYKGGNTHHLTIHNSKFMENSEVLIENEKTSFTNEPYGTYEGKKIKFINCEFESNEMTYSLIQFYNTSMKFENCIFIGNNIFEEPLFLGYISQLKIQRTNFSSNLYDAGILVHFEGTLSIHDGTFTDESSSMTLFYIEDAKCIFGNVNFINNNVDALTILECNRTQANLQNVYITRTSFLNVQYPNNSIILIEDTSDISRIMSSKFGNINPNEENIHEISIFNSNVEIKDCDFLVALDKSIFSTGHSTVKMNQNNRVVTSFEDKEDILLINRYSMDFDKVWSLTFMLITIISSIIIILVVYSLLSCISGNLIK